jgi:hypothetical protein
MHAQHNCPSFSELGCNPTKLGTIAIANGTFRSDKQDDDQLAILELFEIARLSLDVLQLKPAKHR